MTILFDPPPPPLKSPGYAPATTDYAVELSVANPFFVQSVAILFDSPPPPLKSPGYAPATTDYAVELSVANPFFVQSVVSQESVQEISPVGFWAVSLFLDGLAVQPWVRTTIASPDICAHSRQLVVRMGETFLADFLASDVSRSRQARVSVRVCFPKEAWVPLRS